MDRRGFLKGMAGILAAGVAPAVLPSGIIMPIRVARLSAADVLYTCTVAGGLQLENWRHLDPALWHAHALVKISDGWESRSITIRSATPPRIGIRPTGEIITMDGVVESVHAPFQYAQEVPNLLLPGQTPVTVSGKRDGYAAQTKDGLLLAQAGLTVPIARTDGSFLASRDCPEWFRTNTRVQLS